MKKTVLLTVFLLALAAARSESGVDVARNGAQTIHFTAAYVGLIGGNWTCAGERIIKEAQVPFTKDSEDCTITDLSSLPPGTYVGNPLFHVNGVRYDWLSDYDGRKAYLVTLTVTDNGDGTGHVDVVAYY